MAKDNDILIQVEIDAADSQKTLGGLEASIERLKELRDGQEIGSKAFDDLSKSIQKAESSIKDVELQFESLDFEQKLTAGSDAVVGLAGGFAAAEGAAALFGAESEALEETLAKVAGALALSQGLRDMANGIIAMRKLNVQGKIFQVVQKAGAAAQMVWNAAMAANPVGVIVIAVLALVAAIALLVIAFNDSGDAAQAAAEKEKEATEELTIIKEKELKLIERKRKELKLTSQVAQSELKRELDLLIAQGATDEELFKARKRQRKAANESLNETISLLKDQANATRELGNQEKKELDALLAINADNWSEEQLERSRELRKSIEVRRVEYQKLASQVKLTRQEQKNLFNEQIIDGIDSTKKLEREQQEASKKASDRRKQRAKEEDDLRVKRLAAELAAIKKESEAFASLMEQKETLENKFLETTLSNQERELNAVRDKFFTIIELSKKNNLDITLLEEAKEAELAAIREKFRADQEGIDLAAFDAKIAADLEDKAFRDQIQQEKLDDIEELRQVNLSAVNEGLDITMAAANSAKVINDAVLANQIKGLKDGDSQKEAFEKKAFERAKKIQIAQALIAGAQGVVNILSASSVIPEPFGTIYKVAQVAALAATTIAQVSKIRSTQFGGGSGSIGGAASAPSGGGGVPLNNISNTSNLVDQGNQEITQRVVVVESDITDAQTNAATVEDSASF
jgi:hypothetical protein